MNNTTLNIISVHLFSTGLPLELIDITHTWELYKGLMARWALNAPPVTGPSSTQPGVYLKIAQPAWGWKQNYCLTRSDYEFITWWRHQMEIFSALLAICVGNSPVPGEFPAQRPVMQSFDVFFDLRMNKRLSKQSWGWWFETLSCPLWCHCNNCHEMGVPWVNKHHLNGLLPQGAALCWTMFNQIQYNIANSIEYQNICCYLGYVRNQDISRAGMALILFTWIRLTLAWEESLLHLKTANTTSLDSW